MYGLSHHAGSKLISDHDVQGWNVAVSMASLYTPHKSCQEPAVAAGSNEISHLSQQRFQTKALLESGFVKTVDPEMTRYLVRKSVPTLFWFRTRNDRCQ